MSNLYQRIGRLEKKLGPNREPRVAVVTINPDDLPEDFYFFYLTRAVDVAPGAPRISAAKLLLLPDCPPAGR
jgi:hypothetical protein